MSSPTLKNISRTGVAKTLYEAVDAHALVVLKAPMGYGKSTAARELAASQSRQTFHIALKSGASNAKQVWDVVCGELSQQEPPAVAAQAQPEDFSQNSASLQRLLALCKKRLSNRPALLILDDYQNAESQELNDLIVNLARESIEGLRILLLSQTRPKMPLEDLRLKNYAAVFGQELLAFSLEETEALFELYGSTDRQAAAKAWAFSEGWPAALRMCLHSFLSSGVVEPANEIEKLISEIFFSTYQQREQSLLLQLSVLGAFSPEEAVFLSQDAAAPHLLRTLFDHNAFLTYLPKTNSYRLHGIFQSYLANLLKENSLAVCRKINRRKLNRRAGECFAQRGDLAQAIRLWHQAGQTQDMERVLQCFEKPGERLAAVQDPKSVAAIIEDIPWSVRCRNPIGYLGFIRWYMLRMDRAQGARLLDEAETRFAALNCLPLDKRDQIQGEIHLISAIKNFNDIKAMFENYEEAFYLLKERSDLLHEQLSWTFHCPHAALLYLRVSDSYRDLVKLINERTFFFREVSGACAGEADLLLSEHLLETGDILRVRSPLLRAGAAAAEAGSLAAMTAIAFAKARLHLAHGQAEQAWEEMEDVSAAVRSGGQAIGMFSLELCQGYIAAVLGQKNKIPPWLLSDADPPRFGFPESEIFTQIVRGKAFVAMQDWHRLGVLTEKISRPIEALNITFGHIHLSIFKALAAMHNGSSVRALESFSKAIAIARKNGVITSLAEYGRHLYSLQRLVHDQYPDDRHIIILGKQLKKYARLSHSNAMLLTLREQDIIERVVTGENNREIGERLGISRGCVTNNLGRIYAKLGVKNRIEAIKVWNSYTRAD